jgi:hypothetical protein
MKKKRHNAESQQPPALVELADLRRITRSSVKLRTSVDVFDDDDKPVPWLLFGACQVWPQTHNGERMWRVSAYLVGGATDVEHDSAYALAFEVTGLEVSYVDDEATHLNARILYKSVGVERFNSFHVPRGTYDPFAGSEFCKDCRGKSRHFFVDNYMPPYDEALHRVVAGRRVQIIVAK